MFIIAKSILKRNKFILNDNHYIKNNVGVDPSRLVYYKQKQLITTSFLSDSNATKNNSVFTVLPPQLIKLTRKGVKRVLATRKSQQNHEK